MIKGIVRRDKIDKSELLMRSTQTEEHEEHVHHHEHGHHHGGYDPHVWLDLKFNQSLQKRSKIN